MSKSFLGVAVSGVALIVALGGGVGAQQGQGPAAPPRNPTPANMPLATLQDMFVRFPLPPGQQAYANIDGRRLHEYVVEQAGISRKYRDAGHPKFWGRIIGTSADAEDVAWMIARFKAAGLSDVRASRTTSCLSGFRSRGKSPSPAMGQPSDSTRRSRITARPGRRLRGWIWMPRSSGARDATVHPRTIAAA
jgi:hypothetical protein